MTRWSLAFSITLILAFFAGPANAQNKASDNSIPAAQSADAVILDSVPAVIPTQAFANRSQLSNATLSTDGRWIGIIVELDDVSTILVYDASTRKPVKRFSIGKNVGLEWFRWISGNKVIFSVSSAGTFFGDEAKYTRLYLLDIDRGEYTFVGRDESVVQGDNVIHVAEDGSYLLMALQRTPYDYPSVYRFELKKEGEIERVQKPREGVWDWHADDDGVVRLGTGWVNKRLRVYYRKDADSKLKLVGKLRRGEDKERFWDVAQIVSGSDRGYVLQEDDNGRVGIRQFDYAQREVVDTFYEHPQWDIESMMLREGKPVAAFYTDDRDQVVWFDEEMGAIHARLKKALNAEEVWVSSRARDNSRMLVWSGNEADPGVLYVYTPGEKRLDQFAELRPNVDFRQLARPKPVSYTARDGVEISAYLTLPRGREAKNLPLIILPHGGPYGVRDKLDYNDEVQLLANRGYAVIQPNFRGSGGYGEAFFELGTGEIGRGMQDDLDDAMDWAVAEGYVDPKRVCVVGSSYGGYAALWAVIRNPERYRCAASWAGVTDWDMMLKYDRRYFTRKGGKKWRARVEGEEEFDLDTVSPYRLGTQLSRPVLLAHGTEDTNVPYRQFKKMRDATENAPVKPKLLTIKGEGHSFSKPENEKQWYDALEAFLTKHNPAD